MININGHNNKIPPKETSIVSLQCSRAKIMGRNNNRKNKKRIRMIITNYWMRQHTPPVTMQNLKDNATQDVDHLLIVS